MAHDNDTHSSSDDNREQPLARRAEVNAQSNGDGGNGNGAAANGESLNIDDPRTRVLLEQLLSTLSQDGAVKSEAEFKSSPIVNYIGAWRRRWKPMTLVFLLVLAAVAYKLKPGESSYVTTATLQLPSSAASPSSVLEGLGATKSAGGGAIDTQIAVIQSLPFKRQARQETRKRLLEKGKAAIAAKVERTEIKAAAPVSVELIDITVTAPDPLLATELANTCVDVFANRLSNQGNEISEENLKFVQQQRDNIGKDLQKAKNELQDFKEANKIFSIQETLSTNSAKIQELEAKARAARIDAEAGGTGSTILSDSITSNLQQQAANAQLKYEEVLGDFYPSAPEALAAKKQLDAARGQVTKRVNTLTNQARQQAADAQRELNEAKSDAERLPQIEAGLGELETNVTRLAENYKDLNNRYTQLFLSRSAKTATAEAIAPAEEAVPAVRTWTRALATGLVAALIMALACAVLLEQTDHSIHSVDDLNPLLPAAVLGSLPLLKGRRERRLAHITGAQPQAPLVLESCRIIRSNLAFATMDSPAQSILITSADPGEGKSLSALNLATVMAFDGRRVLLLDCDLRRPSQHKLNGLPLEPGFTDVLSGEISFHAALQASGVENLHILTAGSLPLNPPELLGNRQTRQFLHDLKAEFDVIIIDSPPVLALTDAQVLCSIADGVALVVAADSTPKAHVQRAQHMLRHAGGRLLGAIFNKVKQYNNPDAYGGYYGKNEGYSGNDLTRDKQLGESVGTLKSRS